METPAPHGPHWFAREWQRIAASGPSDGRTTADVKAILRGAGLSVPPSLKLVDPLSDECDSLSESRDGGVDGLGLVIAFSTVARERGPGDRLATPMGTSEDPSDVVGKSDGATFSRLLPRVKSVGQAASETARARLSACASRAVIVRSA